MIEICNLLWTSSDTFDDYLKHDTAFSLNCKFSAYIRHIFMHKWISCEKIVPYVKESIFIFKYTNLLHKWIRTCNPNKSQNISVCKLRY